MESLYSRLFNDIFLSWRNEGWKQEECFLNIISLKEAPVQRGGHLFEGQCINFSIYSKYTTIGTFCDTLKSFSESISTFRQRTCNIYCNIIIIQLQFLVHLC